MPDSPAHANRLAETTSPYLRQHAHNPVDWWPWCPEALALAKSQDRPILLSVGYSACHWCHVMAHESFEDAATAAVMNRLFVNIKVDREERPDLDKIYQTAHQILTRRAGGWPLTVFLTPEDQQPFFAGTYFPKQARHGLPAFTDLLERVAAAYREKGDAIRAQNRSLMDAMSRLTPAAGGIPDRAPLDQARRELAGRSVGYASRTLQSTSATSLSRSPLFVQLGQGDGKTHRIQHQRVAWVFQERAPCRTPTLWTRRSPQHGGCPVGPPSRRTAALNANDSYHEEHEEHEGPGRSLRALRVLRGERCIVSACAGDLRGSPVFERLGDVRALLVCPLWTRRSTQQGGCPVEDP